jgi:hypothetical protein
MWNKIGAIFKDATKTQTPIPFKVNPNDTIFRIYYSYRNDNNKSEIKFFEIDIESPKNTLSKSKAPILSPGKPGAFDEAGAMPSCIMRSPSNPKEIWMYYTGWSQRLDVPYHNSIGLAISRDGGTTFKRAFYGPIISSSITDPYFVGTPNILLDNNLFKCWYYSSTGWERHNKRMEPRYHIKYAESYDGIAWNKQNNICIDYKSENEGGICSPSVVLLNKVYRMWFCYRNKFDYKDNTDNSYKIGYAESYDGLNWKRLDDKSGINLSEEGWDSQMLCYPSVTFFDEKLYMFYNGNNFGESGIGVATMRFDYE